MADARKQKRVGILGGTFNPVHIGHLLIGVEALERLCLDKVLLVPCHFPPHKNEEPEASGTQRLEMLRLAVRGDPRFRVDDCEIARGGVSYAIDTARYLLARHPDWNLHFIIGGDSVAELSSWKEAEELVKLCRFVAVGRPGYSGAGSHAEGNSTRDHAGTGVESFVPGRGLRVSSSEIRRRLSEGKRIRYLVMPGVERYIYRNGLYGTAR